MKENTHWLSSQIKNVPLYFNKSGNHGNLEGEFYICIICRFFFFSLLGSKQDQLVWSTVTCSASDELAYIYTSMLACKELQVVLIRILISVVYQSLCTDLVNELSFSWQNTKNVSENFNLDPVRVSRCFVFTLESQERGINTSCL